MDIEEMLSFAGSEEEDEEEERRGTEEIVWSSSSSSGCGWGRGRGFERSGGTSSTMIPSYAEFVSSSYVSSCIDAISTSFTLTELDAKNGDSPVSSLLAASNGLEYGPSLAE